MATPVFACGCECGVVGTSGTASGSGHWDAFAGGTAPTISTAIFRSGLRSIRFNSSAASCGAAIRGLPSSNIFVERFYVRFATLPNADIPIFFPAMASGSNSIGLYYKTSDSKLYPGSDNASTITFGSQGFTVTTGVWYRIDIKIVTSANPWTVDIQVEGSSLTQYTLAVAANTATILFFGNIITTATADYFVDDILASNTSGDYPIGAGYVLSYIPNADGTHNIAGSNDFERTLTGTDITNATTDANTLIDERPLPTTAVDFINGVAPPNSTDYVEWQYEDSVEFEAPRTVEAIIVFHDAGGAGTNNRTVTLREHAGATSGNILNGTSNVGATISYARAHFATVPGTSDPWTTIKFNALRSRFLVSDASPDPYIDAAMLEAEFPASSDQTISPTAVTIPITVTTPTITKTLAIAPSAIAIPIVSAAPTITHTLTISPSAVVIPIVVTTPTITRDQTISPSAVALPIVTATPTITHTLTISPSAVAVPIVATTPTITNTLTISPSPVTVPLVVAAPTVSVNRVISSDAVAIPLVVTTPTITKTLALSPSPVAIPIVVAAPTITLTLTISPSAVAIPIVTAAPTITVHRLVSPNAVAIPIVVATPSVTNTLTISPSPVAIPIVVAAPSIAFGAITISPNAVSVPLVVAAPTISLSLTISPTAVIVPIVIAAPTVTVHRVISPSPVAIPIVTAAPTISHSLSITPSAVAIPILTTAPTITVHRLVSPDPVVVLLVVTTPTIFATGQILPDPVVVQIVVTEPTVTVHRLVSPSAIAVSIVAAAPTITLSLTISPAAVAVPLVIPEPSVSTGGGAQTISPSPVAVPLVVTTPSITKSLSIAPTAVAIPISVVAPTITKTLTITPSAVAIPLVIAEPVISRTLVISPTAVLVVLNIPSPVISGGSVPISLTPSPIVITLVVLTVVIFHYDGAATSGCVELEDLTNQNIWPDNVEPSGHQAPEEVIVPSGYMAPEEVIVPSGFVKNPSGTNLWDF